MNRSPRRDFGQRQGVTGFRFGVWAAVNFLAHLHAFGGNDVTLLVILVLHEGNAGRTHGIVFNGDHGAFHRSVGTVFVAGETPPEIHIPDLLLGATTDASHGDVTITVATAGLLLNLNQSLLGLGFGDLLECSALNVALRGGHGFIGTDGHLSISLQQFDLAFFQRNDGFLPVGSPTGHSGPGALGFAIHTRGIYRGNFHLGK